ncbi:MAG: YciI family protein [Verrucomicrobiota bacterium]|nr:YciI family protein [Verrucomicrobiota bacterium]
MRNTLHFFIALIATFTLMLSSPQTHAETVEKAKQYIYVLRPVARLHDPKAWTERDNASVSAHFKRLQEATASGKVILAGKTDEPLNKAFGIVIFEASTEAEAKAFMEADPSVKDGVMTAELHPYAVALMRK